jgi:hypothetical protein
VLVAPTPRRADTPPPASDHVATTLLLDVAALGRPRDATLAQPFDATTKACSFRPAATLKSFFAPQPKRPADAAGASAASGAGSGKKRCA